MKILDLLSNHDYIGFGSGESLKKIIEELAIHSKNSLPVLLIASKDLSMFAKSLGFYVQSWRSAQDIPLMIDQIDWATHQRTISFGKDNCILEKNILRLIALKVFNIVEKENFIKGYTKEKCYIEVIPEASSIVARELLKKGYRASFIDSYSIRGNWVMEFQSDEIDIFWENLIEISKIPGVLGHGVLTDSKQSLLIKDEDEYSVY